MRVRDIMTQDVKMCGPGASLASVGRIMAQEDCGILPVVGDEERVVGVITDRDLGLALAIRDRKASELRVRLVMSGEVYTCRPDDDVRSALGTMEQRGVRRLPVIDEQERLTGILSLDDVVLEAGALEVEGFTGPFYADVALTLKAIVGSKPALV